MAIRVLKKYNALSNGLKAGIWFAICNVIQKGINFLVMPILTRIMPQADYGIYNTYTSWYNFLMIFTSLRLSYYVFSKGMVKYEDDRNEFVLSLQSLSITSTLFFFGVYWLFQKTANTLLGLSTSLMVCMFIHMLFEPSIEFWSARKRFEYDYKKVVIITLALTVINPVLGIIMILNSDDTVFARALSSTIAISIFGIFLYGVIIRKSRHFFSVKYWKYALAFNIPLIPHFLSSTALSQADRIMIRNIVGPEATAIYSVAYSLGMMTMLFSHAIQQALLPWQYTKLKKKDYNDLPQIATLTMIIIAAICILFIAFAPEVVSLVAPNSYRDAIWAMPPVCSAVYFMYLFNMFANIEYYFEETKYVAVASILAALANIGLNWIFIPLYGYIAAGYTTLFCYVLLAISHFWCMKIICKKHNFSERVYDYKSILAISIGLLVLLLLMMTVYRNVIIRYGVLFVICLLGVAYRKKIKTVINIMTKKNNMS